MSKQDTIENAAINNSNEFVTLSQTAKDMLVNTITQQDRDDLFLRLYVQGASGGISFGMALDSRKSDDDHTCTIDNIDVAIDRISYPYLEGATVDYVEDQEGGKSGFQISSPNADLLASSGGAGCGSCTGGAGCC